MALVKAYTYIGVGIQKPHLRAAMENDIKAVCDGKKDADDTFQEMRDEMKKIYNSVLSKLDIMKGFLENYLKENQNLEDMFRYTKSTTIIKETLQTQNKKKTKASENRQIAKEDISENSEESNKTEQKETQKKTFNFSKVIERYKHPLNLECSKCENTMQILSSTKVNSYFLGCTKYPGCSNVVSLNFANTINLTEEKCGGCGEKLYELTNKYNQTLKSCLSSCFKSNNYKLGTNKKTTTRKVKKDEVPKAETLDMLAKSKKKCSVCGHVGRHPKNSGCAGIVKKKAKKGTEEFVV
jgi:DNA topoisomerase-3